MLFHWYNNTETSLGSLYGTIYELKNGFDEVTELGYSFVSYGVYKDNIPGTRRHECTGIFRWAKYWYSWNKLCFYLFGSYEEYKDGDIDGSFNLNSLVIEDINALVYSDSDANRLKIGLNERTDLGYSVWFT